MSQTLEWNCAVCSKKLNNIENSILKKYCDECGKNKRNHRNRDFQPIGKKIISFLEITKRATIEELVECTGTTRSTVFTTLSSLRKTGHQIKFSFGLYHYGGKLQ